MAEHAQSARLSARTGDAEPTAAELLDPVALEARLVEARARRAEALARRKERSQPAARGAGSAGGAVAAPDGSGGPVVAALRLRPRDAPVARDVPAVKWPPVAQRPEAPAAAAGRAPAERSRLPLLLAAVFVAGLVGAAAAVILAPPSWRQRIAETIAPDAEMVAPGAAPTAAAPEVPAPSTTAADAPAGPPAVAAGPPAELPAPAGAERAPPLPPVTGPAPVSWSTGGSSVAQDRNRSSFSERLGTVMSPARLASAPRLAAEDVAATGSPLAGVGSRPSGPAAFAHRTPTPDRGDPSAALLVAAPEPAALVGSAAPAAPETSARPDLDAVPPAPMTPAGVGGGPEAAGAGPDLAALTTPPPAPEVGPAIPARVVVHHPADSGDAATVAVSALVSAGAGDVARVEVPFTISRTNARYFHGPDAEAAAAVVDVLAASLSDPDAHARDFTSFRPRPEAGLIEVWIAGGEATAPQPAAARPAAAVARRPPTGRAQPGLSDANRGQLERNVRQLLLRELGQH